MYVKRTLLIRLSDVPDIIRSKTGCQNYEDTLDGFFTDTEMLYCAKKLRRLAPRLLIKECIFDYLEDQAGYIQRNYNEIEIINNELRKPIIRFLGRISKSVSKLYIKDILISISHSRNWITAMVVFCY